MAAPVPASRRLSARSVRRKAALLAPRAARMASSDSRRTVRARIRLATLEQAMRKIRPEAASRMSSIVRARDVTSSRSGTALTAKPALGAYASGWSFIMAACKSRSSVRAVSSEAPGASRPKISVIRCARPVTMVADK